MKLDNLNEMFYAKCINCGKEVMPTNIVIWDGKFYNKECFNKHIKPKILAKKEDKTT